jgi:hypothetical protein
MCNIHFLDHIGTVDDFFAELLNRIYGHSLVNLNHSDLNTAAIDYGDKQKRIAVQITSERYKSEIQKTLDVFSKHGLSQDYDALKILIVGRRKGNYSDLKVPQGIKFSGKDDVIDIEGLVEEISLLDIDKIKEIDAFVQN